MLNSSHVEFFSLILPSLIQYHLACNLFRFNRAIVGENRQLNFVQEGQIHRYVQGMSRYLWNTVLEKPLSVISKAYHIWAEMRGHFRPIPLMKQWHYLKGKISCPSDDKSQLNFLKNEINEQMAQYRNEIHQGRVQGGPNPHYSSIRMGIEAYVQFLQNEQNKLVKP